MRQRDSESQDARGALSAQGQNAVVSFDGTTITIKRSWSAPGGKGEASYPLRQVSGIEVKTPGLLAGGGRFTIVAAGGVQRRRDAGFSATRKDPLTVMFTSRHTEEFQALAAAVREALARPEPAVAQPLGGQSLAEQLVQLGQMHAQGTLSDEELAAAKARLLGN